MPKITVLPHEALCPDGAVIDARSGQSICDALLDNHIEVEHACGKCGACSTCHVIIRKGFSSLSEMREKEEDMLDRAWGLEAESRLSCQAPCHRGGYALHDPSLDKLFPFTCDGFCRMHMFEDRILEQFDKVEELYKAGVNEFVFDFSALNAKFVPVLLNKFFVESD